MSWNPFRRRLDPAHMTETEARAYRQGCDDTLNEIRNALEQLATTAPHGGLSHLTEPPQGHAIPPLWKPTESERMSRALELLERGKHLPPAATPPEGA